MLCKFHSVFLSRDGSVLSCGHGLGGRLGHDTEQSIVVSHSTFSLLLFFIFWVWIMHVSTVLFPADTQSCEDYGGAGMCWSGGS